MHPSVLRGNGVEFFFLVSVGEIMERREFLKAAGALGVGVALPV